MPKSSILQTLHSLNKVKPDGSGGYIACCPAHQDSNPSFTFTATEDRILTHCFAGCSVEDITAALGISPADLFFDTLKKQPQRKTRPAPKQSQKFLKTEHVEKALQQQTENPFAKWLSNTAFCSLDTQRRWHVGYSKGFTIFFLVDKRGRVVNGRKFKYQANGHRNKSAPVLPLFKKQYGYKQALYGLWQLLQSQKPVALVESEKTALIIGRWFNQFTWLAKCGAKNLTRDKAEPLRGRTVHLFIDADTEGRQSAQKDKKLLESLRCQVQIRDLWPDRSDGYDLADWFIDIHSDWPEQPGKYYVGEAYDEFKI